MPIPNKLLDAVRTSQQRGCGKTAFVVAAVPLEQKAILAHLKDQYRVSSPRGGGLIFTCGTFSGPSGDWQVITCVRAAGNIEAGAMVRHAAAEFDDIDIAAFVGIAGSGKDDVAIGSVVVSSRAYFVHHGKADLTLLARPRMCEPPLWLVQIAQTIVIDELWQLRVRLPDDQRELLASFGDLSAQVAPVASTEQVVTSKKSETYQTIFTHYNDSCAIEMEGYGTLHAAQEDSIPAIIIRGISDKLEDKDGVNDKRKQPIAAATAAAFFFELLSTAATMGGTRPPDTGGRARRSPTSGGTASHAPIEQSPDKPGDYGHANNRQADQTRLVLILDGTREDFPNSRCLEIARGLKAILGCGELEIERIENGSVVLHLQASSDCIDFDSTKVSAGLENAYGISVLGFGREREFTVATQLENEFAAASLELIKWPKALPNGEWITRAEFASIQREVEGSDASANILLGGPGTGKTSLLSSLALHFSDGEQMHGQKSHFAVLALKADSIPTWVNTDDELSKSLNLSLPVVAAVRAVAHWKPVVFIIDQLDALASSLDLKSERLNLLLNTIRRLSGAPNVHIIASARLFEFEHDARLRATEANSVTLELPAWHQIAEVLTANKIDSEGFNEKQRALLRIPQALQIFLQTAQQSPTGEFSVPESYSAMLDQFWLNTVLAGPSAIKQELFAYRFAQDLANEEALWLPESQYSGDRDLIEALEKNGVLARSKKKMLIGFSHQTLFEHALSRSFIKSDGGLSGYVLARQTSLFIRPKLLVGLRYLRDTNESAYKREVLSLWNTNGLRPHLKLLLIDFLGQLPDPFEWETVLLFPILVSNHKQKAAAWRAVPNSPGWFRFLQRAALPSVMKDEKFSYLAAPTLQFAWTFAHEDVVRLVRENWLPNKFFDEQAFDLLYRCPRWDDDVLSVGFEVLARTQIAAIWVDQLIASIAVYNTDAAIQILKIAFSKRVTTAIEKSSTEGEEQAPAGASQTEQLGWLLTHNKAVSAQDLFDRDHDWQSLPELAATNPLGFLTEMWPSFLVAFHAVARDRYGNAYRADHMTYAFDNDSEGETAPRQRYREAPPLLDALAEAVQLVATKHEDAFEKWVGEAQNSDLSRVHELIAIGFIANPQRWAHLAYSYLLADSRRMMNGTMSDRFGITKELIGAIAPYLAPKEQAGLEDAILTFQSFDSDKDRPADTRFKVLKWTRQDRIRLLKSIPESVRSDAARKQIREEERAFGPTPDRDVTGGGVQFIGSPLSRSQMAKAKDQDLLAYFARFPDDTEWSHPREMMSGGSIQLSREFAEYATLEPGRAISIIRQLLPNSQERLAAYAIEALAGGPTGRTESEVSPERPTPAALEQLILELVAKGFGKDEFRETVARAISKLADGKFQISDDLLEVLIGWLDRPVTSDDDGGKIHEDKADRLDSFLWSYGGLSIVPHGNYPTLEAIEEILAQRSPPDIGRLLELLNRHLQRPERPKVWEHLLLHLNRLGNGDRKAAGEFFSALFKKYPEILSSREVSHALGHAHQWLPKDSIQELLGLLRAQSPQAYGELLTLVAIVHPDFDMLDDVFNAVSGRSAEEVHVRRGVAYSAANLWANERFRDTSTSILTRIIPNATEELAHPILDAFRTVDELPPEPATTEFLTALLQHPKIFEFEKSRNFITDRLLSLLPFEPELVGKLAITIVDAWGKDLADIRTSMATVAPEAVNLALTLHRMGGGARELGMRLFERLLELEAYGAREALMEIDERVAPGLPQRPRLPRRRKTSRRGAAARAA